MVGWTHHNKGTCGPSVFLLFQFHVLSIIPTNARISNELHVIIDGFRIAGTVAANERVEICTDVQWRSMCARGESLLLIWSPTGQVFMIPVLILSVHFGGLVPCVVEDVHVVVYGDSVGKILKR